MLQLNKKNLQLNRNNVGLRIAYYCKDSPYLVHKAKLVDGFNLIPNVEFFYLVDCTFYMYAQASNFSSLDNILSRHLARTS